MRQPNLSTPADYSLSLCNLLYMQHDVKMSFSTFSFLTNKVQNANNNSNQECGVTGCLENKVLLPDFYTWKCYEVKVISTTQTKQKVIFMSTYRKHVINWSV